MDFRGFDSSIILIVRGAIPRTKGNFPERLSQVILVGIRLVGRLGVPMPGGNESEQPENGEACTHEEKHCWKKYKKWAENETM